MRLLVILRFYLASSIGNRKKVEMDTNEVAREIEKRLAHVEELTDELARELRMVSQLRSEIVHELQWSGSGSKSLFVRIAEFLISKGNKPRTARAIMKATGISRSSLSQILYRTHKDSFVSIPIPGYSRKKLWALTDEAVRAAGQLGRMGQATLFGIEGDFTGRKATDCCLVILRERGNQAMNALALAREALNRGYRGKAKGEEDEVLLTTAKSFWAALSRDRRFREVRPLVFALEGIPP